MSFPLRGERLNAAAAFNRSSVASCSAGLPHSTPRICTQHRAPTGCDSSTVPISIVSGLPGCFVSSLRRFFMRRRSSKTLVGRFNVILGELDVPPREPGSRRIPAQGSKGLLPGYKVLRKVKIENQTWVPPP